MYRDPEMRPGGLGSAIFGVVVVALMSYLTFAALQGEYGLFRLFQVETQEKRLKTELDELRAARAAVANKTRRLSAEHLDLELLDERARDVLGLAREDEILIR